MTYTDSVDNLRQFFLELFFPSFCLGCKREGTLLCADCKAVLDINQHHYCLCNQNPLRLPPDKNQGTCTRCQRTGLSGLYFALPYKEKALTKRLIYQFKYEPYVKTLANPLAQIITEHLLLIGKNTQEVWENSVLMPIPMEIKKQKKRGYNQAQLLAKELGHLLNVPTDFAVLTKIKSTKPQMELTKKEREENIKGVFAIKNPANIAGKPFNPIQGKKVFLVDDVYTTGSTMQECARVLRNAGAKSVWGITIAREG